MMETLRNATKSWFVRGLLLVIGIAPGMQEADRDGGDIGFRQRLDRRVQ